MGPARFVILNSLPLNPNGKVDYRALPPIRFSADSAATAPRNDIEVKLQAIFAEVLGRADIGIDDNFFRIGGHSLLAARAAAGSATCLASASNCQPFLKHPRSWVWRRKSNLSSPLDKQASNRIKTSARSSNYKRRRFRSISGRPWCQAERRRRTSARKRAEGQARQPICALRSPNVKRTFSLFCASDLRLSGPPPHQSSLAQQ